jgi:hypothetical protein
MPKMIGYLGDCFCHERRGPVNDYQMLIPERQNDIGRVLPRELGPLKVMEQTGNVYENKRPRICRGGPCGHPGATTRVAPTRAAHQRPS